MTDRLDIAMVELRAAMDEAVAVALRAPLVQVQTLAKEVMYARAARGLTQKALAETCGVSKLTIGNIESADRVVSIATLRALAWGLGIDPLRLALGAFNTLDAQVRR